MAYPKEVSEELQAALERLVAQGLPAATAERAQECAGKMFRLVAEYEEAGLVALGLVGGTMDKLLK